MTITRVDNPSVHGWLQLWGAWERAGGNYLAHLAPKSNMHIVHRDNVEQNIDEDRLPPPPTLTDDDAVWFVPMMSRIKRKCPDSYKLLFQVEVLQWSMREVSRSSGSSFEQCARNYENSVGIVRGLLLARGGDVDAETEVFRQAQEA